MYLETTLILHIIIRPFFQYLIFFFTMGESGHLFFFQQPEQEQRSRTLLASIQQLKINVGEKQTKGV